ncbi:uncharacterized protein [Epargyreus clarus]|uniref:uncharacterized protein n=1 Tax=Epargyreus clarus TaxID=520877 RepID=UPI003C2B5D67
MPFKRQWDASCPKTWDQFERDGKTYIIQDLAPEDDEQALEILINYMCADEALCGLSDFRNDEESLISIRAFWAECLSQRMSLACYTDVDGKKTLVAMNVCVVDSVHESFPLTPVSIDD